MDWSLCTRSPAVEPLTGTEPGPPQQPPPPSRRLYHSLSFTEHMNHICMSPNIGTARTDTISSSTATGATTRVAGLSPVGTGLPLPLQHKGGSRGGSGLHRSRSACGARCRPPAVPLSARGATHWRTRYEARMESSEFSRDSARAAPASSPGRLMVPADRGVCLTVYLRRWSTFHNR